MVPAAGVILVFNVLALAHGGTHGAVGALRLFGAVLTWAFYTLIIWCYLRRGVATATSRSVTAHTAAVVATWTPVVFSMLRGTPPGAGQQGVSDLLLITGTAWSVWSLRFLGRNISVLAQARDLVDRGPYRWVRHPLYTGEIVASLGLAVAANSLAAVAVWLGICGLQAYRALREEQLLLTALPGYGAYRIRTAALLPGIF
jgi:protein-S-isoprenylcysteine O-methyltransferase Ste14